MNPIDILLIVIVAALIGLSVFLLRRNRKTNSCCGNCADCAAACCKVDQSKDVKK